jgi:hypothetical protein
MRVFQRLFLILSVHLQIVEQFQNVPFHNPIPFLCDGEGEEGSLRTLNRQKNGKTEKGERLDVE